MTTWKKVALVVAGYILALAGASLGLWLYVMATNTPDRQLSSGMYAFGDSMLFLGLFGAASLPASGAGLFFLRGYRPFWIALSAVGLALAVTGLAALLPLAARHNDSWPVWLKTWERLTPIRVLVAPLLAMAFFLAGLLAPLRRTRIVLISIAASEAMVFVLSVLHWLSGR